MNINLLIDEMFLYFSGDPKRIQHFIKVYEFARLIGMSERLSDEELEILETAAVVHDIGIKPAEEKYGRSAGKRQEQEGPEAAGKRGGAFRPSRLSQRTGGNSFRPACLHNFRGGSQNLLHSPLRNGTVAQSAIPDRRDGTRTARRRNQPDCPYQWNGSGAGYAA